ncbi:hypothetical protein PRUPE_7G014000 [Prunus persica]|uniref:Uncharacterized protein n=1 Tax=Prunus persica TaxID=3760 RepID=A0A251N813_PRUPE|nr:hypothetical protein PRUPE_7G014000 [Prunus persica]
MSQTTSSVGSSKILRLFGVILECQQQADHESQPSIHSRWLVVFVHVIEPGSNPTPDSGCSAYTRFVNLDRWLALQLLPTVKIGLLQLLEEILLHYFAYPSFLVSGDCNKLYQFVKEQTEMLT